MSAATCEGAVLGPGPTRGPADTALGDFVLVGTRTLGRGPGAFGGHGYRVVVTLPWGTRGKLSVPEALRAHVGLAYTRSTGEAVRRRGISGADRAVLFTACPRVRGPRLRTAWAGGIVVDHPRCAALHLSLEGEHPVSRRVPLGRACAGPVRAEAAHPTGAPSR